MLCKNKCKNKCENMFFAIQDSTVALDNYENSAVPKSVCVYYIYHRHSFEQIDRNLKKCFANVSHFEQKWQKGFLF